MTTCDSHRISYLYDNAAVIAMPSHEFKIAFAIAFLLVLEIFES